MSEPLQGREDGTGHGSLQRISNAAIKAIWSIATIQKSLEAAAPQPDPARGGGVYA